MTEELERANAKSTKKDSSSRSKSEVRRRKEVLKRHDEWFRGDDLINKSKKIGKTKKKAKSDTEARPREQPTDPISPISDAEALQDTPPVDKSKGAEKAEEKNIDKYNKESLNDIEQDEYEEFLKREKELYTSNSISKEYDPCDSDQSESEESGQRLKRLKRNSAKEKINSSAHMKSIENLRENKKRQDRVGSDRDDWYRGNRSGVYDRNNDRYDKERNRRDEFERNGDRGRSSNHRESYYHEERSDPRDVDYYSNNSRSRALNVEKEVVSKREDKLKQENDLLLQSIGDLQQKLKEKTAIQGVSNSTSNNNTFTVQTSNIKTLEMLTVFSKQTCKKFKEAYYQQVNMLGHSIKRNEYIS